MDEDSPLQNSKRDLRVVERPVRPPFHFARGATGSPVGEIDDLGNSSRFLRVRVMVAFLVVEAFLGVEAALGELKHSRRTKGLTGVEMDRAANIIRQKEPGGPNRSSTCFDLAYTSAKNGLSQKEREEGRPVYHHGCW